MKIGASTKWLTDEGELVKHMNFRVTTVKHVSTMEPRERVLHLEHITRHNLQALTQVILEIAKLPEPLRMWRIGSDLLPLATHKLAQEFYHDIDMLHVIEAYLRQVGKIARKAGIRLSFHPGQFVVIGSKNPIVRERSRTELEYHAQLAWWMGYRTWHQDGFAVNVHVGGKESEPKTVRHEIKQMSKQLQNVLTLENDEFSWSAQRIVAEFGDLVPLVPDVHHFWIMRGQRMSAEGRHIDLIKESWRGVRPKLHLAISHSHLIPNQYWRKSLDLAVLMGKHELTKGALRAHSSQPWHKPTLDYVRQFTDFDIMWEGGDKMIGAKFIAKYFGLL